MLDSKELKTVITTLSQRHSWLLKSIDDPELPEETSEDYQATLKIIDSAMLKLSKATPVVKPTGPLQQTNLARKSKKKPSVQPEDAYALIAEDNAESVALLREALGKIGVENIETVEDGRAALYALQNCSPPYDLVLCDWDMPEMTGLEVRIAVKNLAKLRDTHFVMVSAISEAARIKEAISHGINDYIVKPVDIDILERKVRAALAGTASLDGSRQQ